MADPSIAYSLDIPLLPLVDFSDPAYLDLQKILNALRKIASSAGAGAGTVTNTLGSLTQYAVIVGNGTSDIQALASLGTAGQVLTSNGPGVAPSYQAAAGGITRGQVVAYISLPLTG